MTDVFKEILGVFFLSIRRMLLINSSLFSTFPFIDLESSQLHMCELECLTNSSLEFD